MQIFIHQIETVISDYWSDKGLLSSWTDQPSSLIKTLDDFLKSLQRHPKNRSLDILDQFRLCKILLECYSAGHYLLMDQETYRAFNNLGTLIGSTFFQCLRKLAIDNIFNAHSFSMIYSWPTENLPLKNISKQFYYVIVLLINSGLINKELQIWLATLDYFEIQRLSAILTALDKVNMLNVGVFPVFDNYQQNLMGDNTFYYISDILDNLIFDTTEERTKNGKLFAELLARIQGPTVKDSSVFYKQKLLKCLRLLVASPGHLIQHPIKPEEYCPVIVGFLSKLLCKLIRKGQLTFENFQFLLSHPDIMVRISHYFGHDFHKPDEENVTKLFDLILHFAKRLMRFRAVEVQEIVSSILSALDNDLVEKLIAHPNPDELYEALRILKVTTLTFPIMMPQITALLLNVILNEHPFWTAKIMQNLASRSMLTDQKILFLTTLNANQIEDLYNYIQPTVSKEEIDLFFKSLEREQLVEANRFLKPLQQDRQSYFSLLAPSLLFFNRTERCIFHTIDEINKILEQKPPRGRSLSF
jgi:hypothetical protein